ncbi:SpoIVB peptidase [Alkalihalobacillus sp. AL-G]|uniref:SpoIVB peptidase n=1 Tax=Alkalihalobacillus sp. AL-G TaxID=2926399 RepID=UPI00272A2DDA|nr:SpoIVB peptidase [Alkalihalobacillus sp. AL-G]WLD91981.1 SpoIVB peptidase [Alkalihalobacillus sp. AL-G]
MKRITSRQLIGILLLGFLISLGFLKPVQDYLSIPTEITVFQGERLTIDHKPLSATIQTSNEQESILSIGKLENQPQSFSLETLNKGNEKVTLTVSNIPVKKVDVKVLPEFRVIPGGQTIGVKLNTVGVLVVGHHLVETSNGDVSPGEKAGIRVGDMITAINGKSIQKLSDVAPIVKKSGKSNQPMRVTVLRDKQKIQKKLSPVKDKSDETYRIGLYIRDSAAGVGTMTFYHPESGKYGALGHVISDMDTKKPIVVNDGQIIESTVTSIEKGSNGHPGEKLARFSDGERILGTITKNTQYGIFGKLNSDLRNGILDKAMPIALSHQVKEGPAEILTVVKGDKVQKYDVEIISSVPQKFPATKGLVIKITDPDLLKATGGIVQGMSGSPIIQNGKVVGAVTHVFVNDPTSGYGVHIEWMLNEAGINIYKENRNGEKVAS